MKSSNKLFKKLKNLFNNEEMLQLFEKYIETQLSADEQKKLDKWVNSYKDRQKIFENLKKMIKFHKELSVADESEVKSILKKLKDTFPNDFADISDSFSPYLLLRVLRTSVGQLNWKMCWRLSNGNKWIRVLAFVVRTATVLLIILITYGILFHKSQGAQYI